MNVSFRKQRQFSSRPERVNGRRVLSVFTLACFLPILASFYLGFEPFSFFSGLGAIWDLLLYALPIDFSNLDVIVAYLLETLGMALLGTLLGSILAIPLAFMMSERTQSNGLVRAISRAIAIFSRAVPDVLFAYVIVAALGIGPFAGTIAIAISSIGMVAKLSATAISNIPARPVEALEAAGASRVQSIFSVYLPSLAPTLIATVLYRFDINIRSSAILGLVGAGGIGLLLRSTIGQLDYQGALAVILSIFVLLMLIESASVLLRKSVLDPKRGRFSSKVLTSRGKNLSPLTFGNLINWLLATVLVFIAWGSLIRINPGIQKLFSETGSFNRIISQLFHPDFTGFIGPIGRGFLETIAIAIVSTFLGGFIGLMIGIAAARSTGFAKSLYVFARTLLVAKRGFPTLVFALIFVAAVGLGPTAGILALSFGTGTVFAKFVADTLEDSDSRPQKATLGTGATRIQTLVATALPQAFPSLLSHYLYTFDINLRASTILGIVGAGGVGYELIIAMRGRDFETVSAIMLGTFALIYIVELASKRIRDFLD